MNEQLRNAIQLIENGQHEEGLQKVEKLSGKADDETKRTIAELYYELGLVDRALPLVEELMFNYPENGELFAFAAECYSELGREDEAVEMLNEIDESDPAFIQSQLLLADIYQNQGLEEVAEQKLLQAEKLAPEEPVIQFGLGEFYLNRGDYHHSIPYFKKVIHQNKLPEDHPLNPALRIAEAYGATGQFEEALEYYEKGLQKEESSDGLFGYGYTALQVDDYETAVKQFTKLKETDPDYTTLFPYLAKALRSLNRMEDALEVLKEGISRDEYNEELYLEMARLQFSAGNGKEGQNYLEKVIAINPSNVSAVQELLLYFREEEMYDETIDLVTFLHDYGEYDPFFERYKGKALYENDRLEEAAEAYKNALEAFEEDETLLEEAAYANLEAGRKDSGISYLKKLLSLQPDRLDIEERLANLTE